MIGKCSEPKEIILYLHIPKTGGTTLESCIYDLWSAREEYVSDQSGFFHSGIYYYPFEFFYDEKFELPNGSNVTRLRMRRFLSLLMQAPY